MDGNYYDCIDCGTENCPCSLAETGDCIVCSRLSGKDFCDCDWKGVCVYNEFVQNGKKSSGIRGEQEMSIVRRDGYGEETTVLVLDCGRGFALKCLQPGSFLFLKKPKDHHFYSMPVSVLAAEPEKGRIPLAVRAFAAKSKHLLEEGETLTVRGVYPNGILGIKKLRGTRGRIDPERRIMILTKGLGFAPAALLASWIGGRARTDLYIDEDKIDKRLIRRYLPKGMNGRTEKIDLRREFAYKGTERISEKFHQGGYNTLVVLTSDYYISEIKKILPVDACSNNFRLCCGEGICGACSRTDDQGRTFRMCKCSECPEREQGVFDK